MNVTNALRLSLRLCAFAVELEPLRRRDAKKTAKLFSYPARLLHNKFNDHRAAKTNPSGHVEKRVNFTSSAQILRGQLIRQLWT